LRVTSPYWQPILRQPQQRRRYGLSIHIDADGREYAELGLKIIDTIAIIYTVDLVENPAAGGRFLPYPGRREIIRRVQNVTV
jgi:hypothetical protein